MPEASLRFHERIAKGGGGREGLLDRAGGDPAVKVEKTPGLVVRSRASRAPEGLLADDRPRWLVVYVEVAGGVAKRGRRALDEDPIAREDRARQRVGRGLVAERERLVLVLIGVDPHGQDGSEDLFRHEPMLRIGGLDQRRRDE